MEHITKIIDLDVLLQALQVHNKSIKDRLGITDLQAYCEELDKAYIQDIRRRYDNKKNS